MHHGEIKCEVVCIAWLPVNSRLEDYRVAYRPPRYIGAHSLTSQIAQYST
jgi:hypothetical protein